MRQKIIKVGNSAAVTLPKNVLEEKNLTIGDEVDIDIQKPLTFKADKEIQELTKKIIEQYRPALEELAHT